MQDLFLEILNMHRTAAVVILVVLAARILLRNAPKKWSYALWSVVGFRLVCPVSFEAAWSLFNLATKTADAVRPGGPYTTVGPITVYPTPEVPMTVYSHTLEAASTASASAMDWADLFLAIGTAVWLIGIAVLLVYGIISYVKLKYQMSTAVWLEGNIWQSDRGRSPFILGYVYPTIYIPFGLDPDARRYVLAHERCHLKHWDHWVKALAFLLLAVHWFDPLVWAAFHFMAKDMEMRTDEEVLTSEGRTKTYSLTLLSFAANRCFPAPSPLAFGESGVKTRIKNALHWKKPKIWMTVLAAVLCVAVVAACSADAPQAKEEAGLPEAETEEADVIVVQETAPTCAVSIYGFDAVPVVSWFPEGHDAKTSSLTTLALPYQDTYRVVLSPEWDCGALTVDQAYYTEYETSSTSYRNTVTLEKQADGRFYLDIPRKNAEYKEFVICSIPYDGGALVFRLDFEVRTAAADPLEAAIHQAILTQNQDRHAGDYFACESHVVLAHVTSDGLASDNSGWSGQDTVYLMALYQKYEITAEGITDQGGSHMPIMLAFDRYADGTYKLVDYWRPMDGNYYESSIKETFPEFIREDAMDTQKYITAQIQDCYAQAVAYAGLDTTPVIEGLFEEISSSPSAASAPGDYTNYPQEAVRELTYYGNYTLEYIFRQFLNGGETGLKGQLMRCIMDLLIGPETLSLEAETGQAYFDAWKEQVLEHYEAHGAAWMQEQLPKGWLLLQLLDLQ